MLQTEGLTKRYGQRLALSALTLSLPQRCFVVLLGPNGAGKSTLFQLLTGLFAADAGDARVAGHSLRTQAVAALRHIGVVFQQLSLDLDLSVRRNLQFHADLHGLPRALAHERIATGDRGWFFSYENICETLEINPEYLRRGLDSWRRGQSPVIHQATPAKHDTPRMRAAS